MFVHRHCCWWCEAGQLFFITRQKHMQARGRLASESDGCEGREEEYRIRKSLLRHPNPWSWCRPIFLASSSGLNIEISGKLRMHARIHICVFRRWRWGIQAGRQAGSYINDNEEDCVCSTLFIILLDGSAEKGFKRSGPRRRFCVCFNYGSLNTDENVAQEKEERGRVTNRCTWLCCYASATFLARGESNRRSKWCSARKRAKMSSRIWRQFELRVALLLIRDVVRLREGCVGDGEDFKCCCCRFRLSKFKVVSDSMRSSRRLI